MPSAGTIGAATLLDNTVVLGSHCVSAMATSNHAERCQIRQSRAAIYVAMDVGNGIQTAKGLLVSTVR